MVPFIESEDEHPPGETSRMTYATQYWAVLTSSATSLTSRWRNGNPTAQPTKKV